MPFIKDYLTFNQKELIIFLTEHPEDKFSIKELEKVAEFKSESSFMED